MGGWLPLPGLLAFLRDLVFMVFVVLAVAVAVREGPAGLARRLLGAVQVLPGVEWLIAAVLRREVRGFLRQVDKERRSDRGGKTLAIPEKGQKLLKW